MAKKGGIGGGMPNNMNNLMKQAQKMQKKMQEMQEDLDGEVFEASAGGGAVKVTVTGKKEVKKVTNKQFKDQEIARMAKLDELTQEFDELKKWLKWLKVWIVIWELEYRILNSKFPHVFEWGTWAEYLKILLKRINLTDFIEDQQKQLRVSTQIKKKKILQKIKLASNLFKSGQRPEWFILEVLPIIPPDLRPMIQLDRSEERRVGKECRSRGSPYQ